MQIGTLVKLVRVLMLGPVVLALSLITPRARPTAPQCPARGAPATLHRLVPWFIIGFLALAGARSFGLVPHVAAGADRGRDDC